MDIIPSTEPFFFRGGPVGVLLVHGFTGTPKEMRPLGEDLAARGYTALGVRLAQHATRIEDMRRARWQDWFNNVLDGYFMLRGQCSQLFVMGLSMGGLLSLRLATHYPLAGVVSMSAPSGPIAAAIGWRARLATPLSWFVPAVLKKDRDAPDPGSTMAEHYSYPAHPVRAAAELVKLIHDTAAGLPRLTAPVLMVHSRGDGGVPLENMDYLYQRLGSADKDRLILERSGHIVTRSSERGLLFERIHAFLLAHPPA